MSTVAAHATAFYREVSESRRVWTVRDAGGFPAPMTASGRRSQPFWSSKERAEAIITSVDAYRAFEVVEIEWAVFRERWVPGLKRDGIDVGVNWSGARATGYDVAPDDVVRNVMHYVDGHA